MSEVTSTSGRGSSSETHRRIPNDVWIEIFQACAPPPRSPSAYQSGLEACLDDGELRVAKEMLAWTRVSTRFSTLAKRILYSCVVLPSFESCESFSKTIVVASAAQQDLGFFVKDLNFAFRECKLWGPPSPKVGLPQLLSLLPNLRSIGQSPCYPFSSPIFLQSLHLLAPRLTITAPYGLQRTASNFPSFIAALSRLSASLQHLQIIPSAEPSFFLVNLLPRISRCLSSFSV
ncbi:hypothetical protein BDY24DRAFT_385894 [Mrakia frigida]|uniref:uncharacterized protein n=1 Tax=Mrakia frigida TaxID=29902 RepID=UPI003FCC05F4